MADLTPRAERGPREYGPIGPLEPPRRDGEDAADVHVRRWEGWADVPFETDVEAILMRCHAVMRYLGLTTSAAVETVGLKPHDYATLQALMVRETPGHATIGQLAETTRVTNASMTGRIDRLVKQGNVRRLPSEDDRRVVHVQITDQGFERWKKAMHLRGAAEARLFEHMSAQQRRELADQLRVVTLGLEQLEQDDPN